MFFWTTQYFHSVTVATTWQVIPLSQNLNWPSGKLEPILHRYFPIGLQLNYVLIGFIRGYIHEKSETRKTRNKKKS